MLSSRSSSDMLLIFFGSIGVDGQFVMQFTFMIHIKSQQRTYAF